MCVVVRDSEPVLRRFVHGRNAAQAVQSRSAWIRRVAVQSFRLFRGGVQHHRGGVDLHAPDAAARRQRSALRPSTASLQSNAVSSNALILLSAKAEKRPPAATYSLGKVSSKLCAGRG